MKAKKTVKRIMIGVVVLLILLCVYRVLWRVDILASISITYLDDYRDYYFHTELVSRQAIWGSVSRQIIYIKPGQKGAMLKKIKEDLNNSLETLIEEHGDIYYKYEIDDDLKRVQVYRYRSFDSTPESIRRIVSLIGLYHDIKGDTDGGFSQQIRFIEPNS